MGEFMNDLDFDSWLDGNSWTNLGNEFYECPGGHIYHEIEVVKLYNESQNTEKELPKDFMSKLTFEEGDNQ
jgi:hypothetical protein